MYRKSLVIKKYKDNISKLTNEAAELLRLIGKEKDYKSFRIMLDKYNSIMAKVYITRRKIENLNNGLPELGRSIDSFDNKIDNSYEE